MSGLGRLLYVNSGTLQVMDRCDFATNATIRLDFGTIQGGTLTVGGGPWNNSGTVRVGAGSSLAVRNLVNAGGTIQNLGGSLRFQGRTSNQGSTLTIDAPSGTTRLEGEIFGGTVHITPGTVVDSFLYYAPGNLNATSVVGDLRIPDQPGAGLVIAGELTLNGAVNVLGGEVRFANNQTITGGTFNLDAPGTPALALLPVSSTGALDQDPLHGARGDHEEVPTALPVDLAIAEDPRVRVMHQFRRLQRVPLPLAAHQAPRPPAELLVDDRKELVLRGTIPRADPRQELRDLTISE